MRLRQIGRPLPGAAVLAAYALLFDGSGVGTKQRWNRITAWTKANPPQ